MTGKHPFKDVDGQEIFFSRKREGAEYDHVMIIGVQWFILTVFGEYEHKIDDIQLKTLRKPIHLDGIEHILDAHDGLLMSI